MITEAHGMLHIVHGMRKFTKHKACVRKEIKMFDLKNLNDDYFSKLNVDEILEIKELSFEDKVKCFEYFLNTDYITNASALANIFILINGIKDSSLLEEKDNPKCFFKDLEEYVDIKITLKNSLDNFCIKLVEYFLGVITGLSVVLPELKAHIPNTHFNILSIASIDLISKLFSKYIKMVNLKNVKPVFCAEKLYYNFNKDSNIIATFFSSLLKDLQLEEDTNANI